MERLFNIEDAQETTTRRGASTGSFGTVIVSTPSTRSAVTAVAVDRVRQHEGAHELAVAAFDLVILLARHARLAAALQRQPVVVNVDAHLLARQAGSSAVKMNASAGFAQVDGRRPALRAVRRQALEAVLDADQIAERVPARKDHDSAS